MNIRIAVSLAIMAVLIIGCGSDGQKAPAKLTFEIKEFNMKYDDTEYSKSYSGEGSILAVGDAIAVKKPYLVFVKYEKTKGGALTEEKKGVKTIEVVDGIGKITTFDSTNKKGENIEKPEYIFEVVGYVPLIPLKADLPKDSKVNFELKDFHVEYKEELFFSSSISSLGSLKVFDDSYLGKGTIVVSGAREEVIKPYIVTVRLERIKGGRENDTDTKSFQTIAIVNGIGTFSSIDNRLRTNIFGKEISLKIEKPEYKIELIGYRKAEA